MTVEVDGPDSWDPDAGADPSRQVWCGVGLAVQLGPSVLYRSWRMFGIRAGVSEALKKRTLT